uniref:non-specific serine/threonine protein kinase n=1 Tax=Chromera velia CCMP2878 TaxID=1169474 RepID=A0A0G4F1P6_9ALVE|eukprot:Cvel_2603.t1-p1 / transcript=Cvel_2603.t1 / gene=Cvel_2603 / organism=Chromera_velia_CCMP2878 / gene_product=Putative ribosomal protein S6 kinase alpha-1, putative / transcript_product=Putative ribosomal protein S6 kinase alpha-1, putative / location=Cvel_scaffold103:17450-21334(-) / protein_length=642 / sequence_SO=supercontig / SO=protein_coding / is_pseudo=false
MQEERQLLLSYMTFKDDFSALERANLFGDRKAIILKRKLYELTKDNMTVVRTNLKEEGMKDKIARAFGSSREDCLRAAAVQMTLEKKPLEVLLAPIENNFFSVDDFHCFGILGRGSFGHVLRVVDRRNRFPGEFALKVIRKGALSESRCALVERNIMATHSAPYAHPFIARLLFSFQSEAHMYMGLELCHQGTLKKLLKARGRLPEKLVALYVAEVLLAFESLHANFSIFRDLKPDNVLLDAEGHVKLSDFGLSKERATRLKRTYSYGLGTDGYMAPEVAKPSDEGHSTESDLWSLGVFMYELIFGQRPFTEEEGRKKLYAQTSAPVCIPFRTSEGLPISQSARDLMSSLMQKAPAFRLGAGGRTDFVRHHRFFRDNNIDFEKLRHRDFSFFDTQFLQSRLHHPPSAAVDLPCPDEVSIDAPLLHVLHTLEALPGDPETAIPIQPLPEPADQNPPRASTDTDAPCPPVNRLSEIAMACPGAPKRKNANVDAVSPLSPACSGTLIVISDSERSEGEKEGPDGFPLRRPPSALKSKRERDRKRQRLSAEGRETQQGHQEGGEEGRDILRRTDLNLMRASEGQSQLHQSPEFPPRVDYANPPEVPPEGLPEGPAFVPDRLTPPRPPSVMLPGWSFKGYSAVARGR